MTSINEVIGNLVLWGMLLMVMLYFALTSRNWLVRNALITVSEILIVLSFVVFLFSVIGYERGLDICWLIMAVCLIATVVIVIIQTIKWIKEENKEVK